ncbi:MAG: hypothetical protein WCG27_13305, partial [Pseudomonadota bacterium]
LFCDLGYSCLFNYCVDYLKYSEGEAQLRISSMRLMKNIPAVKEAIEQGQLSLTNASLLSRHIKEQEKESGTKLSIEQKTGLVRPLCNLPKRQAEKVLNKLKVNPTPSKIKIEISSKTLEKLLPQSNTRYIPAAVKRAALVTANHQCQYISPETGKRCQEKGHLEFDHVAPFTLSGSSKRENLRVYCRHHNLRHAIVTLGQQTMDRYIN